jgi:hypothetical protein
MRIVGLMMVVLAAGTAADAQRKPAAAIWPKEAAGLPPIALGELIARALPRGSSLTWGALQVPAVRWLTDGIETTTTGYSLRNGVARVRAGGVVPMMLRQGWVELGWSAELESSGNAKFGPEAVTLTPGMTDSEHMCFGTRFKGCSRPIAALSVPRLSLRKACERGPGQAREMVFAAAASGRSGTMVYRTDSGSGDSTNSVVVMPGSASAYCARPDVDR